MADWDAFRSEWERTGDSLVTFPANAFDGLNIPVPIIEALTTIGLPESAAPLLTFGPRRTPSMVGSDRLLEIGSDGAGNPVVVGPEGTVTILDHENSWAPLYVNASLSQLSDALLAFRSLVEALNEAEDRNATSDDPEWLAAQERFVERVRESDLAALEPSTFWATEFSNLTSLIA